MVQSPGCGGIIPLTAMRRRDITISAFVLFWLLLFTYQTLRVNHLTPLLGRALPRVPLLFPPAGWIMFYQIDARYGFTEVYGIQDDEPTLIDPHDIFATRAVGYDNIHRNVLIGVLYQERARPFCRYLRRKFPDSESFAIVYAHYPDAINTPERVVRKVSYRCQ